jgi:hypothetical protein
MADCDILSGPTRLTAMWQASTVCEWSVCAFSGAAPIFAGGHVSSIPEPLVSYSRRLHNLPAQTISTSTGIAVRNAAHEGFDRKT